MAVSDSGGGPKGRARKNRERAAEMKRLGIERTTGRCAVCYRIVQIESRISRYTHICR
jgi:hypothetical protein